MRRKAIFWGCFFLSLGSAILLIRNGIFHLDWHSIQQYWAVILIFWGFSILARDTILRHFFSALFAIVLGFGLASVLSDQEHTRWTGYGWQVHWQDGDDSDEDEQEATSDDDESAEEQQKSGTQTDSSKTQDSTAVHADSVKAQRPVY